MSDQKTNPQDYTYSVLAEFPTRYDAVCHEIFLHSFYDVAKNEMFYNRAKQTSTGFDTSGSKEVSRLQSIARKGLVHATNIITGEYECVTQKNFINDNNLVGHTIDKVSVLDLRDNTTKSVSKSEYDTNSHYVGVTSGSTQSKSSNKARSTTTSKTKKAKAKEWFIYNTSGNLEYTIKGNLIEICKVNNLPYESLREVKNKPMGLYMSNMANPKAEWAKYKGWTIRDAI